MSTHLGIIRYTREATLVSVKMLTLLFEGIPMTNSRINDRGNVVCIQIKKCCITTYVSLTLVHIILLRETCINAWLQTPYCYGQREVTKTLIEHTTDTSTQQNMKYYVSYKSNGTRISFLN